MTENTTTWNIDPGHSEAQFRIKHLAITNVNGTFDKFSGYARTHGDDFNQATVHFEIEADSINTNNAPRDNQLKSPDLFNTIQYPKIVFDGKLLQKDGDDYTLDGELTLLATKRPISLAAAFTGSGKGRFNDTRAGFEVSGKISRKDYGLSWNILNEAGGLVIGDEVKLHFDIQLIREA